MQEPSTDEPTCRVYGGRDGAPQVLSKGSRPADGAPRHASIAGIPLHRIMTRDLICARADLDVRIAVGLMVKHHIGCIPVIDERQRPIGVITKLDIVEQIDAAMSSAEAGSPLPEDLRPCCADEVMMPLAFTLSEHATAAQAAALMMSEDIHHVIVVAPDDRICGVVSSRDLVGCLLANDNR